MLLARRAFTTAKMGVSEEDLRIVKLTKFKKMSSTYDLHRTNETSQDTIPDEAGCANDDDSSMASDFPDEGGQSLCDEDETSSEGKSSQGGVCGYDQGLASPQKQTGGASCHEECSACPGAAPLKKGRTRRKSWCVESSLKKQFNRDSELRRTLERSEGLPPVLESRSSSPALITSSARIAGIIDQRLRRLRLAGKAMTLAIPSERRRARPSIFDSGRRKSEAGIPLTLANLKARRKSEGNFVFEGLRAFPEKLRSSNTRMSLNGVLERRAQAQVTRTNAEVTRTPDSSSLSPLQGPKRPKGGKKTTSNFGAKSWPNFTKDEGASEDGLVQEILSFNSRNIFEVTPTAASRRISPPILSVFDETDSKVRSVTTFMDHESYLVLWQLM